KNDKYRDPKSDSYHVGFGKQVPGAKNDARNKHRKLDKVALAEKQVSALAAQMSSEYWNDAPFRVKVNFLKASERLKDRKKELEGREITDKEFYELHTMKVRVWRELRYKHSLDAAERALTFASLIRDGLVTVELQKKNFKRGSWHTISTLYMKG